MIITIGSYKALGSLSTKSHDTPDVTDLPTIETKLASVTSVSNLRQTSTITPTQTRAVLSTETAVPILTPTSSNTNEQGKLVFACQIFRDPDRNQICLINADGSNWKRLSSDDNADHTYPHFTPDGQTVILSLKKFGSSQIYEMDLSGNMRQLSDLPFDAYASSMSPDNQQIVFTTNDGRHQTLWIMNRDGKNAHQITDGSKGEAWDPAWSPDGKQILFASYTGGKVQLFVMEADGSNIHRLTNIDELRGRSDWSPTAQIIATYKGPSWHREIVTLSLEGTELEQITDGGNNLAPNFSPNGQWIAFTSYRDHFGDENGCEIYVMRIDGSETTRLTNNDYCDWQPNWGP
jgi:TolB protein